MATRKIRVVSFVAPVMALSLFVADRPARADVNIFVANPSFETLPASGLPYGCGTGCSYSVGTIPGWVSSGSEGQFQPGSSSGNFAYFNYVPDGVTVAYSNGGTISQTVGPTVVAGDTYTLTVDLGNRNDGYFGQGYAGLEIGSSLFVPAAGIEAAPGTWTPWTAAFTGTALTAGDSIQIVLGANAPQGDFDNVSLTSSAANTPEPGFYGILALGLGGLILAVRLRASRGIGAFAERHDPVQ